MPTTSITVKGLSELAEIPGWLDDGQKQFVNRIGHRLADAIEDASPRSHIPFHAHTVNSTEVRIQSDHPGAKALDKGAYIAGKGKLLKFTVAGRLVFTKFVRLTPRNYVKKGLRKRSQIVRDEYAKAFDHLGH